MNKKVIAEANLPLKRIGGKNKIREMYDIGSSRVLMVATDKVSAFDVVMKNCIPFKGSVLTAISAFWFGRTMQICPNHFITTRFDFFPHDLQELLDPYREILEGRSMLIQKADPLPIECIVRGYLLGSAWKSYKESGIVCGIELPEGLHKGQKLSQPIFTPSTKAVLGQHDENITFEQACDIVGSETARTLKWQSIRLYSFMADEARSKGIVITDTKFEFGKRCSDGNIIQIDESGTPDSSRYDPDYSKEPLRVYLESIKFDKKNSIELPPNVVKETSERYLMGCEIITGRKITA